jgi:hypothetical protein
MKGSSPLPGYFIEVTIRQLSNLCHSRSSVLTETSSFVSFFFKQLTQLLAVFFSNDLNPINRSIGNTNKLLH